MNPKFRPRRWLLNLGARLTSLGRTKAPAATGDSAPFIAADPFRPATVRIQMREPHPGWARWGFQAAARRGFAISAPAGLAGRAPDQWCDIR